MRVQLGIEVQEQLQGRLERTKEKAGALNPAGILAQVRAQLRTDDAQVCEHHGLRFPQRAKLLHSPLPFC